MYTLKIIKCKPYVASGNHLVEILAYDANTDSFIRKGDCKLSAKLIDKVRVLQVLNTYHVYLNRVTGKKTTVRRLKDIPGNVANRGLSEEYIKLDTVAIEYARLVKQLNEYITNGDYSSGYRNTLRAMSYLAQGV